MLILVFDTSMRNGTVGWVKMNTPKEGAKVVDWAHMYMPAIPGHAERLLERMDMCLNSGGYGIKDVNLIVIGQGPGTFTGLRIGFSTAKALCLANQIPLVTVPTLEMLARNAGVGRTVVALLDARRNELYMGAYRLEDDIPVAAISSLLSPRVVSPGSVETVLRDHHIDTPVQFVGDGAVAYADKLVHLGTEASMSEIGLNTYQAALCGYSTFLTEGPCDVNRVEPLYLREPDARKPKPPLGSTDSN